MGHPTGANPVRAQVNQTTLLKTFLPEAEKEFNDRSEADKAKLQEWYPRVTWFVALRRVGLQPSFAEGSAAKRARLA